MMWRFIQKLFGRKNSDFGQAPSLPSLLSASKKNSTPEQPPVEKKAPRPKNPEPAGALEKLVALALSQVGVKEVGGNNCGAKVREYQSATNLKPAPWPWCAAFTGWLIQQWLKDKESVKWLNLKTIPPEQWRPKTAAAFGYIEWAKNRPATTKILSSRSKPQAGDFAIFDFSHIGIVTKVLADGRFQCVEGNTNGRGTRDSTSGDGVWLKTRTPSLVRGYVRIQPSK
jgi:hypothetical protein